MSQADTLVSDYDMLMDLIRTRTSVRKLKSDPIYNHSFTGDANPGGRKP